MCLSKSCRISESKVRPRVSDMTTFLKLTLLCLFAAVVLAASTDSLPSGKEVDYTDLGDDFPSDESVRIDDGQDEEGDDRLHIKKKPSGLHGFLVNLIKPKPHKKPSPQHHPKNENVVTKTTMIQVTKRVTTHPVCMTVNGEKPQCILKSAGKSDDGLYIMETTAIPDLSDFSAVKDSQDDSEILSRSARYLSFDEPTPEIGEVKSAIVDDEIEDENDETGRFIFHKHSKKVTVTKTLYVTKVQKVTNYGITATLSVSNCIPIDVNIPYCPKPVVSHGNNGLRPNLWKEEDTKEMLDVTEEPVEEISE